MVSQKMTNSDEWWLTPNGRCLLAWEQAQLDEMVHNIFGYHALQIGTPQLNAFAANRIPQQWLGLIKAETLALTQDVPLSIQPAKQVRFFVDSTALPFPNDSLDLIILLHTLEHSGDAHATLREVDRVLRPEGRFIIVGLNPFSLWTLKKWPSRVYYKISSKLCPHEVKSSNSYRTISCWSLLDWLKLLDFEIEELRFGVYQPLVKDSAWLHRCKWMNQLGQRWWPIFGAAYLLSGTKKVHGMRLPDPAWRHLSKIKTITPAVSWFQP
jgi:SAM-dependent methyltransferase